MSRGADLRRIALFLAAGGLNTLFGYLVFAALLWSGMGKDGSVVCSTIAGVVFNFGTYRAAFDQVGLARLPHFVGFYAAILLANILGLRTLSALGVDPYVGQATIILAIVPVSYFALNGVVFPQLRDRIS